MRVRPFRHIRITNKLHLILAERRDRVKLDPLRKVYRNCVAANMGMRKSPAMQEPLHEDVPIHPVDGFRRVGTRQAGVPAPRTEPHASGCFRGSLGTPDLTPRLWAVEENGLTHNRRVAEADKLVMPSKRTDLLRRGACFSLPASTGAQLRFHDIRSSESRRGSLRGCDLGYLPSEACMTDINSAFFWSLAVNRSCG